MDKSNSFNQPNSDFIVNYFKDLEINRRPDEQLYNLEFGRNLIIKGILTTEGNLATERDISLLTTGSFSNFKFESRLNERDIQEVWAMNKALRFMEDNYDKPLTREIIEMYNYLVVVGSKSKFSGEVRRTNVFINGTAHRPPDFEGLSRLFENSLFEISTIQGEVNKAFSYLLMISKNQIFIDGNKRTGLLSALHHLVQTGQRMFIVRESFSEEFLTQLRVFYETSSKDKLLILLNQMMED